MNLDDKLISLKKYLRNLGSILVAYSSGVDSTFLLKVAHDELKENVIAVTFKSCFFTQKELKEACEFCKKENITHIIIDIDILKIKEIRENPSDRCYICKKELFKKAIEIANQYGIKNIIEGSNIDDISDYRPGMKAISELEILSPLKDCNFSKFEIRELSKQLKLKTAQKPSMACLASRIPYGEIISEIKLKMIERAENFLFNLEFKQLRVRLHGENTARIEILQDEFYKLIELREKIVEKFKEIGFKYISLDIEGYRTGSWNQLI